MRLTAAVMIAVVALSNSRLSNAVDYVRARRVQGQNREQRDVPRLQHFSTKEGRQSDGFVEDTAFWERYLTNEFSISMPTENPVPAPTSSPLPAPTKSPKPPPTPVPTDFPVVLPTPAPVPEPSAKPSTRFPTFIPVPPSDAPSGSPLNTPTAVPVTSPTETPDSTSTVPPTKSPSAAPVISPTDAPVSAPTVPPTKSPTAAPVVAPTKAPVATPTTDPPTDEPVGAPTARPIQRPSKAPVVSPTDMPTKSPVVAPTDLPTKAPVVVPTTEAPVIAPDKTLLEIIQDTPELSTLLTAIETADNNREIPPYIAEELNSTDPLTIFAPINGAFDAFETALPGYLDMLLTPEYGLHLFSILAYHVTSGTVSTADFPVTDLAMLAEGTVNVTGSSDSGFTVVTSTQVVDDASIVEPFDVLATNGILHSVDNLLVPRFVTENLMSALEFLQVTQGDNFSTLLRLIRAAGLETTLAELEGVTLLAPTNDAIPPETEQFLLAPGNEEILNATITYHVINQLFNYAAQSIPNILLVDTIQGEKIVVGLVTEGTDGVAVSYNQATQQGFFPVQYNIGYVIDRILVPTSLSTVVPRSVNNIMRDPSIKIEFSYVTHGGLNKGGASVDESLVEEMTTKKQSVSTVKAAGMMSDIDITVYVNGHEV